MLDTAQYLVQAELFGIVHRPAQVGREAVAIDPHQVDIAGAQSDAFVQQLDTLVDQHEQAAVVDLLGIDRPSWNVQLSRQALGQGDHLVVFLPLAAVVEVETPAGLLAIPAQGVKFVAQAAVAVVVVDRPAVGVAY
ncbi:hypothetical protein D3C76_1400410 [compost metagenome]